MYRRKLLVGCLLSFVLPGCLDAPTAAEDEPDPIAGEIQEAYVIHLESTGDSVEDGEGTCEFADLTREAQREVEQAIDEEGYRVEETPGLMKRNCHNGYVEYEGEYYWLRITIESG